MESPGLSVGGCLPCREPGRWVAVGAGPDFLLRAVARPGETLGQGGHCFVREAFERGVHVTAGAALVTVEPRGDGPQPSYEPFGSGAVQGERPTAHRGHLRRQGVDQPQQAASDLDALRRRPVPVDDTGDATQRRAGAVECLGVVDAESLAESLELREHLRRGRVHKYPGRLPRCLRTPDGHVLPRA